MREDPTFSLALKVFWALFWRNFVVSFVVFCVIFVSMVLVVVIMGIDMNSFQPDVLGGFVLLMLFVCGFIFNIIVFKWLMTNGFGKYKLAVISNDA